MAGSKFDSHPDPVNSLQGDSIRQKDRESVSQTNPPMELIDNNLNLYCMVLQTYYRSQF